MVVMSVDLFIFTVFMILLATVLITRKVMKSDKWYSKAKRFMNVWFEWWQTKRPIFQKNGPQKVRCYEYYITKSRNKNQLIWLLICGGIKNEKWNQSEF